MAKHQSAIFGRRTIDDMGLDITAYELATIVRTMTVRENNEEDTEEPEGRVFFYQDGTRPQSDGLPDGVYEVAGEAFGFRAGSYSGYNHWRDALAQLMLASTAQEVWNARRTEGPFVELINFSDCEGFIGPLTSAKLAADFASHADKAAGADDWFRAKYAEWQRAFTIAAKGGIVQFH